MADRRLYLEMIQGVVNRLSNNSFLLKGWTVVLVAGLFTLADFKNTQHMILLAYYPAIAFWGLDAYFLREERLFRKLYASVREKQHDIDYSLDTEQFKGEVDSVLRIMFSKTLCWFYLTLLITLTAVLFLGG